MILKKNNLKKGKRKSSILNKMLINTFYFTVIPLLITGLLIVYAYQSLTDALLGEKGIGFSEEIVEGLNIALQNAQIQAFLTLFIVIILTLFGNILISRNLIQPLKKLVKASKEITKGNLDFKVDVGSGDELGELSVQFNRMTQELKEAKIALEGAREMLEKRVEARTEELKKVAEVLEETKTVLEIKVKSRTQELENFTKGLEAQIKQRTKELQEKVKELEKFQKFSVGREIKMVELKEEIKGLKQGLEKEKM